MNHQLPLPLYNTLYEFNQLHSYPPNSQASYSGNQQPNQQSSYSNSSQQPAQQAAQQASFSNSQPPNAQTLYSNAQQPQYPPIQQHTYPASSQPPYARSQQTPYPTSQLPTPYPTADSPYQNGDSGDEDMGHSSGDEPEQQPVEPAEPEEPEEPDEPEEPEEVPNPAPPVSLDQRSRATKRPSYRPRKRSHGEFREVPPDGIDLSRVNEEGFQPRDLLPPPERVYNSFDECLQAVTTFAQAHGLSYSRNKWSRNMRQRLMMVCGRSGVHKDMHKEGTKRRNMGLNASKKCDCKMQFWILAMDYTNLDREWRVKWANDRKSIVHNHPPQRPKVVRDAPALPARIPGTRIA